MSKRRSTLGSLGVEMAFQRLKGCWLVLWKIFSHMAVCQNLVPLVNIKIAGKWMFIPLKMDIPSGKLRVCY